ncbi:MAG: hypothetical protein Q9M35_01100 [Rhodothermus sp.]|nr:hypothetical protein [Rhodothermus sp.]
MGKMSFLWVGAVILIGSVLLLQADISRLQADDRQVRRQEETLAREIARSAHERVLALARELEVQHPEWTVGELVAAVNGEAGRLTGSLQGGSYEAWLYAIGGTGGASYGAVAIGRYGRATHRIGSRRVLQSTLEVAAQPSQVKVTFLESMAGYCSAIYLQRYVPREDGTYDAQEPELVFAPQNRHGADGTPSERLFETVLNPGERANFILAVDKDCSLRGRTDVPARERVGNQRYFDYLRPALVESVSDLRQMQEGDYVMIQPHPVKPNTWRLAFEDLQISPTDKLWDVKRYGYGDMRWRRRWGAQWGERHGKYSYGGQGWHEVDAYGYYQLRDYYREPGGYALVPDFSDQVIEVTFVPVDAGT